MNDFLPADYELPQGGSNGNYSKLEIGENKFRVLSKPIIGRVYFTEKEDGSRKPVRVRKESEVNEDEIAINQFGKRVYNHFWAFVVWDYRKEAISILEINKSAVLSDFVNYLKDEDYANPTKYDIIIGKSGSGKETRYTFKVGKEKPVTPDIKELYIQTPVDLEKMFEGGNPYEVDQVTRNLRNTSDHPMEAPKVQAPVEGIPPVDDDLPF